jgi:uncharacterized membrane protein YccC
MPSAFWRTVLRFDATKIDPEIALRNTVGIALPLAAGILLGNMSAGVVGSLGALNVCYSDTHDPYPIRARRMFLASVVVAVAVAAGALSATNSILAVATVIVWAFVSGMFVVLGPRPGDLGTTTVVTFAIFAARSLTPLESFESALVAFAGGILEMLLAIAFWPVNPWLPERRTIASVYRTLADIATLPAAAANAPPGTDAMTEAQHSFASDRSAQSERLSFLLHQAERIRLSLLNLRRMRRRVAPESIDAILQLSSQILNSVAESVEAGHGVARLAGLNNLVSQIPPDTEARHQANALAGQLRAASGLSAPDAPGPPIQGTKQDPLSRLMRLRANLTFDSTVFRHAVRLALSVGAGTAIARAIGLQRGYWLPMTIAIVLKPDFAGTFSRGVLRIAGTLIGLALATALFHVIHLGPWTDVALVTLFALILRWAGPANYGIFVIAMSGIAVLLIAITGIDPNSAILARATNTVLGGALALAAYLIWPTWERTQTGAVIANMMEDYRIYFRRIIAAHRGESPAALDSLRLAARLARSNAEASVTRLAAEPGARPGEVRLLDAILVSSHAFVRAVMALESVLYGHDYPQAPPELSAFCDKVDLTLAAIAQSLAHRTPLPGNLPDLREAWLVFAESQTKNLLETETDRLTTSLNTLKEQVATWSVNG